MILQLGVALAAAGTAILQTAVSTLFQRGPQPRQLTPREIGVIVREDQRLRLLGERAIVGEDPFTGGTLLARESQTLIPGLIEQLTLEAAVRREETRLGLREIPTARQLLAGRFPVTPREIAAARALSGTPRVVSDPLAPPMVDPPTRPAGVVTDPEPPPLEGMIPITPGPVLRRTGVPIGCFPGTIAGRRACAPLRSAFV